MFCKQKKMWKFCIQKMRLCLPLCVLYLLAPVGYSQLPGPPGLRGPKGEMGEIGPAGPAGPAGRNGARGFSGLNGATGPAIICGRDLLDFVDKDLEALKKSFSKLELAVTYNFIRKAGQKYFVSNKKTGSFSQAIEFCSQQDLELALPKNEKENNALTHFFDEMDKMVWINVNNKKAEGNFETDMKKRGLNFTKWGGGQPDTSVGETGCTMLSENGVWRVSSECSLNAYIICQI